MSTRTHRGIIPALTLIVSSLPLSALAQEAQPAQAQPAQAQQAPAPEAAPQQAPATAPPAVQGTVYVQPQYAQPQPYAAQPAYGQPYYGAPAYAPAPQAVSRTRPNLGLIISGAVLLGVGWIANIITGLPAGDDPFDSGSEPEWTSFRLTSLIPVAGPWIQLGVKPTAFDQDYWAPWLILDGIMQTLGATLLVIGIATPQTTTVVADRGDGFSLALAPSLGPQHGGLALTGTF